MKVLSHRRRRPDLICDPRRSWHPQERVAETKLQPSRERSAWRGYYAAAASENVTSRDVAEQIGVRAVICVIRLGRCAVNHWLIILRRGGEATTSIASIRLFRSQYIIFTYRSPKQSYRRIIAPSCGRRAPRSVEDVKSAADLSCRAWMELRVRVCMKSDNGVSNQ